MAGSNCLTRGDKSFWKQYQPKVISKRTWDAHISRLVHKQSKQYLNVIHASMHMTAVQKNLKFISSSIWRGMMTHLIKLEQYQIPEGYHYQASCLCTFNNFPLTFFWRVEPPMSPSLKLTICRIFPTVKQILQPKFHQMTWLTLINL